MKNIKTTRIDDNTVISTGIIHYKEEIERFQYETWIFKSNPFERSKQIIHGSWFWLSEYAEKEALKIHGYISNNLKK